ncbi:hypothetical protein MTR_4g124105 [Medicago truncatula]|uniref:Uncharacterized protein n=1 Tax=Medicago truncatula TaxID=3880 RepID=A0A072URV9_MEDTR|nr:hypothetical protein MTR_4g124105 [Medicago truncatula]
MAFLEIVFRKERDSWYNKIDTIKYQLGLNSLAQKENGISYKYREEGLTNKSPLLLRMNLVHLQNSGFPFKMNLSLVAFWSLRDLRSDAELTMLTRR